MACRWIILVIFISILRDTFTCRGGKGPADYNDIDNGANGTKFNQKNLTNPDLWPKGSGWEEDTKKSPYKKQDYDDFINNYKKYVKVY